MTSGGNLHLANVAIRIAQVPIEGQEPPVASRTPSHWDAERNPSKISKFVLLVVDLSGNLQ
jgi:hypothetical protein